ncbi:MAG: hypothetical protein ABSF57_09780 [Acidobacteriaceae bacterium]|jgi:hypothetical protein
MTKYEILINILDRICAEGRDTKLANRYSPDPSNPESLNQIRGRAFIHLYLMVRFGVIDFVQREHWISDGAYDGGIDGYYIDKDNRTIYLIQSKFRTSESNFAIKEIRLDEILRMDIIRILEGNSSDESGNDYCGKIMQLQKEISIIEDIGRYTYRVAILANIADISPSKIKQLTGGFPTDIVDSEECYRTLVFPVISGTYFNASDLNIYLDLSNKSSSASKNKLYRDY